MGLINWKATHARWLRDQDLVREEIELFVEHAPVILQDLQEAMQAEHASSLAASASSLRSLVQPFRVKSLSKLLQDIENLGERGEVNETSDLLRELRGQVDELFAELMALHQDLETKALDSNLHQSG